MKYYHATNMENLVSISEKGLIAGMGGVVYLTTRPEDALKFMLIRFVKQALVIEVDVEPERVEEQFDHNEAFFKCKAFGHMGDIPVENITKYDLYK